MKDNFCIENAAYYGYYDIVKLLLEYGANPLGHGGLPVVVKARGHYKTFHLLDTYMRRRKLKKIISNLI